LEAQKIDKIGTVQWLQVKRHSRILYVRIPDLEIRVHDIQKGDKIKVGFLEIQRLPRAEEDEEKVDEGELSTHGGEKF
jgi:hypothetical protein